MYYVRSHVPVLTFSQLVMYIHSVTRYTTRHYYIILINKIKFY